MIDTGLVARQRDRLLERGRPSLAPPGSVELDGLPPYEAAALERVEPLAELLVLMMSADGRADVRELEAIRGVVRTLTDGLVTGSTADLLVFRCRTRLEAEGLDERVHAVTTKLLADREDAEFGVMLATAVALADGRVSPDEHRLFGEVAASLGIGARRLEELLGHP